MPRLLHWGADLGAVSDLELAEVAGAAPAIAPSSPDIPLAPSVLAGAAEGWTGMPALIARRSGMPVSRIPVRATLTGVDREPFTLTAHLDAVDDHGPLLHLRWRLTLSEEGVVTIGLSATAPEEIEPSARIDLYRLAAAVGIPRRASELLDFSGLWAGERRPWRGLLRDGVHLREQRHGRPGHDAPFLTVAGTPGFGFRSGEVWALHHAWSGNSITGVESLPTGHRRLIAAELLDPGEVSLAAGATYEAPETVLVHSLVGLDGLSDRLHPYVRRLSPPAARPLVINTWEAVYFEQSFESLAPLVDAAGELGVERFVLDDGWFAGRRDDRRALGDWTVDPERWPEGLHPLAARVAERGMDFGLWVEPEMVSPESRLAAEHPEWMLATADAAVPPTWRFQHTLDLAQPAAAAHLLAALSALLEEYPIRFLKWDHNRDHMAGGSAAHTRALYALLDAVRQRFPEVAIESCASGGGRIDLGIVTRVHRFWTSDTNDALERQRIQRYTGILLPPELLGGHVGAPRAHITGRTHDLSFRLATALFGHAGIEWDVTRADDTDRAALREWVAIVKRLRPLLHGGRTVRTDEADDARFVHGVVSHDGDEALIALVTLGASPVAVPPPLRFPGLDPERHYRVQPVTLGDAPRSVQDAPPAWLAAGSITVTGRTLSELGLPVPLLAPEQALVLHVRAVE